uniref:Ubiquitin carboxyl-terminal hydrolase n=1 Tax=Balaenoptera musculus TaxID=9771 RepID=A0A8C0I5G8_BALMU
MAALMVHGFVQIWNMKTGITELNEACIEIVEKRRKVTLVISLGNGEYTAFQLRNNIKNIVLRPYGEDQNYLHLTFQTNDLLFIERLSSRDAKNLKMFLNRFHQNHLQPPVRPDRDGSIFASTTIEKVGEGTSFCNTSSSQPFEKERNETPDDMKMPLFASESLRFTCEGLLENRYGKRKRKPSSGSEINKNFLQENTFVRRKKSKMNTLRYVSHNKKKLRLKRNNKLKLGPSFKIDSTGNSYYLDVTDLLQRLSEKIYLAFLLGSGYGESDPDWHKLSMIFEFYPQKLWQGLPNLGNTCYMNSVLQSLFSVPSFADDLLKLGFSRDKIPLDALSICLVRLLVLKDTYNIKIKAELLVSIKKAISAVAEIFSDNMENDAHEFLGHCLDQVKQNVGKLTTIGKTKIESEEGNSPQQVSAGSADTKGLVCPVLNNFDFELLHSIICKACGHVVRKTEASDSLSVNLPQGKQALPLSVQSSFDLFFEGEELEYKCEKCNHRSSIAVHKFSRLPRVLIVHLKRYKFNEFWSLRKDDRSVIINKYLKLSSHCNETTKPPLPLSKNAPLRASQVFKVFQKMNSETISSLTASTKQTSESKDSLAPHIRSDKESEPQKRQTLHKGSRGVRQQKDLGKYSKLGIIESTLTTEEFCKDKKNRIAEESCQVPADTQPYEGMRLCEQDLWLALLRRLPKPDTQWYTEKCRRPTELSFQGAKVNSLGALGSSEDPGNKGSSDVKQVDVSTDIPKREAKVGDSHDYRLIGVISHLGKRGLSGHYISDAYNFERREWLTYSDLQVSSIQEAPMQEARLCTGYIFFYMHNEIFEELTEAGVVKEVDSEVVKEHPSSDSSA